jgi:hypothetical protein
MPLDLAWVVPSAQELRIALGKIGTFGGVLVDADGKPLAGARVRATLRFSRMAGESAPAGGEGSYAGVQFAVSVYVDSASDLGAPKETVTAADGSFTLPGDIPSAIYESSLEVRAADGSRLSVRQPASLPPPGAMPVTRAVQPGLHTLAPGERPRFTAVPSARIKGRVISEVPGLDLTGLTARIPRGHIEPPTEAPIDREGRFVFDDLDESPVDVILAGPGVHGSWTFAPTRVGALKPGATLPVSIRVLHGVEVRGQVVARGSGKPGEGVEIEVWSPAASGAEPLRTVVGADGRYTLRLPPGDTILAVSHPGERFIALQADGKDPLTRPVGAFVQFVPTASAAKFAIPEGAATFDAPPIEVAPAVTLHGRLVAKDGKPISRAQILPVTSRPFRNMQGPAPTDERGAFQFRPGNGTVEAGQEVHLGILRPGFAPRSLTVTPDADGFVEVVVPDEAPAESEGIKGELNGVIVEPVVTPAGR